MSRILQQRLLFFAIAVLMSFHFAMTYARALPPAFFSLYQFAYGPIDLPYRPRVLMRWVYLLAFRITHDQAPQFVHGAMSAMQVTIFVIALVAMMTVVYLTRASIGLLVGKESRLRWFSLITVYMCCYQYLLTPQIRAQFPYDVPAVASFAIGIYAILTRNRWLFYPLLIIGTLNRETVLFLIPIFLVLQLDPNVDFVQALRKVPRMLWFEVALQLVIWGAIVHTCNVITDTRLGPHYQLRKNMHFLPNPFHWPTFLSIYGFLWIPWLVFFKRIGNVNFQRVAILLPFWFAAMLWKADLLEIRVQSEWIPYVTICLVFILRNSLLVRDKVTPETIASPAALPGTSLL